MVTRGIQKAALPRITHYENVTNGTDVTNVTNIMLVTFEMLGYALNIAYKIVTNVTDVTNMILVTFEMLGYTLNVAYENVTNVTDVTNMILVTFETLGYTLNVAYKIVTNGTIRTLGTSKMIHYVSDAMHVNITNGILFANFIRFMEFIHTMRRMGKFLKR